MVEELHIFWGSSLEECDDLYTTISIKMQHPEHGLEKNKSTTTMNSVMAFKVFVEKQYNNTNRITSISWG